MVLNNNLPGPSNNHSLLCVAISNIWRKLCKVIILIHRTLTEVTWRYSPEGQPGLEGPEGFAGSMLGLGTWSHSDSQPETLHVASPCGLGFSDCGVCVPDNVPEGAFWYCNRQKVKANSLPVGQRRHCAGICSCLSVCHRCFTGRVVFTEKESQQRK